MSATGGTGEGFTTPPPNNVGESDGEITENEGDNATDKTAASSNPSDSDGGSGSRSEDSSSSEGDSSSSEDRVPKKKKRTSSPKSSSKNAPSGSNVSDGFLSLSDSDDEETRQGRLDFDFILSRYQACKEPKTKPRRGKKADEDGSDVLGGINGQVMMKVVCRRIGRITNPHEYSSIFTSGFWSGVHNEYWGQFGTGDAYESSSHYKEWKNKYLAKNPKGNTRYLKRRLGYQIHHFFTAQRFEAVSAALAIKLLESSTHSNAGVQVLGERHRIIGLEVIEGEYADIWEERICLPSELIDLFPTAYIFGEPIPKHDKSRLDIVPNEEAADTVRSVTLALNERRRRLDQAKFKEKTHTAHLAMAQADVARLTNEIDELERRRLAAAQIQDLNQEVLADLGTDYQELGKASLLWRSVKEFWSGTLSDEEMLMQIKSCKPKAVGLDELVDLESEKEDQSHDEEEASKQDEEALAEIHVDQNYIAEVNIEAERHDNLDTETEAEQQENLAEVTEAEQHDNQDTEAVANEGMEVDHTETVSKPPTPNALASCAEQQEENPDYAALSAQQALHFAQMAAASESTRAPSNLITGPPRGIPRDAPLSFLVADAANNCPPGASMMVNARDGTRKFILPPNASQRQPIPNAQPTRPIGLQRPNPQSESLQNDGQIASTSRAVTTGKEKTKSKRKSSEKHREKKREKNRTAVAEGSTEDGQKKQKKKRKPSSKEKKNRRRNKSPE